MVVNKVPVTLLKVALQTRGQCQIRVSGSSMHPTIKEGDNVEVAQVNFCDLYPGLIVAYLLKEEIIVHRIHCRIPTGYITVGDNNILLDDPLTETDYLGVVMSIVLPNGTRKSLKPIVSHTESCMTTESNITIPEVLIYLPDKLIKSQPELDIPFTSLTLHPISILDLQQSRVFLGISPNGLLGETHFLKTLKKESSLSLICLANFGSERMGPNYLPVNLVREVYRLDFFNHWWNGFPHQFIPSALLCYIDALIRGASYVSN